MLIGSRQKVQSHKVSISIGGKDLMQVVSTKYLGVVIDQHLTWQNHINHILKSVWSKVYGLCRLKPLPTSLLATLYCGYVLPIFDYCDMCGVLLQQFFQNPWRGFIHVLSTPYLVLILLLGLHLLSAADFTWLWWFLNQLISLVLYI